MCHRGAYKNSLKHERALKTGKMLHKISKMFKMSTCVIIKVLPLSRPSPLPPPSFQLSFSPVLPPPSLNAHKHSTPYYVQIFT